MMLLAALLIIGASSLANTAHAQISATITDTYSFTDIGFDRINRVLKSDSGKFSWCR